MKHDFCRTIFHTRSDSVELHETCLDFPIDDARSDKLGSWKARIELLLVGAHLSLLVIELTAESQLTLAKDVFSSRGVTLPARQQSHACRLGHTTSEATALDIRTLRSIMLAQAPFERVNILDCFAAIAWKPSFIETDIAITACAVWVILDGPWMQSRCRSIVPALLSKPGHRICRRWAVLFEKAAIVCIDEGVSAWAVRMVMHSERIWPDLSSRYLVHMLPLENIGVRHAVNWTLLQHFIVFLF